MGEWKLKAKDLDSYTSFLGRLNKLGSKFFIKNDIIYPTVIGTKSSSTDKIPGQHFIQDPFHEDFDDAYGRIDGVVYRMATLGPVIEKLKKIKEENPAARKDIRVIKTEYGMSINLVGCEPIIITTKYVPIDGDPIHNTIPNYFGDMEVTDYEWDSLLETEMVSLRDNGLMVISQRHEDMKMWSRIAKSVFPMAGTTKTGTPIAKEIKFTFIEPSEEQKDVATLRFLVTYKTPGGSSLIDIRCIHQYRVFVY